MKLNKAKNGDVIKVNRTMLGMSVYCHYAVYVETPDGPHAIHYTEGGENSDFKGVVRETSLEEFTQGNAYDVKKFDKRKFPRVYSGDETVARARSHIGEGEYDLLENNCEHFATWCKTGRRDSGQAKLAEFLAMPLKMFKEV